MPRYDGDRYEPAAPVANASLRSVQAGNVVDDVLMLLDTGADITLLPRSFTKQLGVAPLPNQRFELMGFDGNRSFADVVSLDLILLGKVFRGKYLLTDEQRGILGRDVLNHLSLALNGPALEWHETNAK